MAGRIRTIKPEWLEHERLSSCSDAARVLSVGLVLLADDYGNGRASARYLAAQVWGYRSPEEDRAAIAESALEDLIRIGYARRYVVDGSAYYNLPGWNRHQRITNAGKRRCPEPPAEDFGDSPNLAATRRDSPRESYPQQEVAAESYPQKHSRGDSPPDREREEERERERDREEDSAQTRKPRKHALPDSWVPNATHTTLASELGLTLEHEAAQFRDHATANGRLAVRWDAAFAMWLRRAAEFRASRGNGKAPARGLTAREIWDWAEAEERAAGEGES